MLFDRVPPLSIEYFDSLGITLRKVMEISRKLKGGKTVRHPRSIGCGSYDWTDNRTKQRDDNNEGGFQSVWETGR